MSMNPSLVTVRLYSRSPRLVLIVVTFQITLGKQLFNTFQGKTSIMSPNCTNTDCALAKVCYLQSGSTAIAKQNCIPGFGSVQSPFTGK